MILDFFKKIPPYFLVYFWITILILGGALLSGYILTLDMAFVPDMNFFESLSFVDRRFLWEMFISILNLAIPAWLIQKMILVFILFVSGASMHCVLPLKQKLSKYFAGLLYMINPFVYTRLLAGQINHLIVYAILPLVFKSFLNLMKEPSYMNALKIVLWLSFMAIMSLQMLYIGFFMLLVMALVCFFKSRDKVAVFRESLFKVFFIAFSFFAVNFYWIFNFSDTSFRIDIFDMSHIDAFVSSPDSRFGILFNVFSMYGFWGENDIWGQSVIWAKNLLPVWYVIFGFIFLFVFYGVISGFKNKTQRKYVLIFLLTALASFVFSVGSAHLWFLQINNFFREYIPFFRGFREPQKWSALLILSYCFLGGIGLNNLLVKIKHFVNLRRVVFWEKFISYFGYALIVAYTFTMFGGFLGQLKPVDYPDSWYKVNEILNVDADDFQVLFLPWHLYMSFEFNHNRLVTNPAELFFDKPVIRGDNMELGRIYSSSARPASKNIENMLATTKLQSDDNLIALFSDLNIKYIIYADDTKSIEKVDYSFLQKSEVVKLIYKGDHLTLYKVDGI